MRISWRAVGGIVSRVAAERRTQVLDPLDRLEHIGIVTTLSVVASPGTGAIYTLAAGLSRGSRASTVAAFGCTLGIVPHMAAAMLGIAAVLHASALAFNVVKYAGVAYLLFMAWHTLRETGALVVNG